MRSPLVEKFWLRMGEMIGRRWIEQYGPEPPAEWATLIERYSEHQVMLALDNLPKWDYPPTHPAMAAHLKAFAGRRPERTSADWIRDYWKSVIVGEILHWGAQRDLWPRHTSFDKLPTAYRSGVKAVCGQLVDDCVMSEQRLGVRSPEMLRTVSRSCEAAARALHLSVTRTPAESDRYGDPP